jgi:hypothetical protein
MIPKECKRLAGVDFPIAVVSKHSAREKSIRHGHPSTLHPWLARRPLAACRAMLLSLILPDPWDGHCPARLHDLLIEVTGESKKDKAAKVCAARTLWVPGVNNHAVRAVGIYRDCRPVGRGKYNPRPIARRKGVLIDSEG